MAIPTAKPALLRQLGVTSASALVVSSMIGVGIFGTTGFLAGDLGSPTLVLWIWVVGAVTALLGAMCYSELGINLPSSGGEYVYLTRAYGPSWGFMTGWVSFFAGFSAPIAVVALAFADYLGHVCRACAEETPRVLFGSGDWELLFGKQQLIACAVVVLFTVFNLLGVQRVARVQNVLTGAKIAILVAFIALAFTAGNGSWQNFSMHTARTSSAPLSQQFAISLFFIYLSYSGWNAATYVAEELKQPSRTLPMALAIGTGLVAVLYLVLNVVFIYAMPLETMKGEVAVGALAASRLFGPGVATAFAALMALSLMASINAQVITGPRVYYAMAKNGAFLASAAKVHPKWHTPWIAIIAQGVCTMLLTMTPFRELVSYIGFTLSFFTAMGVASLFYFRRQPGWQKLPIVSFCWPLVPILFIIPEIWIVIFGVQRKPFISLATVITMVTGALVYHFRIRSRTPEQTVETY
ncbi:MAG TPA: amino acid permease [Bryobacteraceae bacterium]|nr:amino acid permease [Bryobacteraceae bacterium]